MKIIYKTNLDKYRCINLFPTHHTFVPRINESVEINKIYHTQFRDKSYPISLRVVNVTYCEDVVKVELHYRDIDLKTARLNNISLF